jgi:hypothetical protein
VVKSEFDSRSRAGSVEISKVMQPRYLAAGIGAMEQRIAGTAPQFGCWGATSGTSRMLWWRDASTLWSPSNGQLPGADRDRAPGMRW